MLPFLNLTSSEFFAPDALKGTSGLVPDAADGLQGGFASVLQSQVIPAVMLQAPVGEDLPPAGNALPVTGPGDELPPDVAVELSIEHPDLVPLGPEPPLTGSNADLTLTSQVIETAPVRNNPEVSKDGLPVTMHVPPAPQPGNEADAGLPPAGSGATGDVRSAALHGAVVAPVGTPGERDSRGQTRDRALDVTTLPPQTGTGRPEHTDNTQRTLSTDDGEVFVASRRDTGIDDLAPGPRLRRASGNDAQILNRTPAESPLSTDGTPRPVRDDALAIPRPLQPAAWQQGSVAFEAPPESGQRIHADVSAVMPRAAAAPPAQAAVPLPPAAQSIDIPVQQSGWDTVLADRVTMMANGKLQNAELRLTPAELGPLRIQLEIDDGVANVSFQSQHPVTREALEQAMPRLRELLAENGLSLGQADVRDDNSRGPSGETLADAGTPSGGAADSGAADETMTSHVPRRASNGLVDTFV